MFHGPEIQVKLNNYGYRTKDIKVPKPRGKYRILCVGGSTTFEGRTNEFTYPSLLGKKLNKYFQSENIEIYNCGISGLNSEGERNKMDDFLALEPDLIIEYNLVNDFFWVMEQNKKERTNRNIIYKSLFLDSVFFKFKYKEVTTFLTSFTIPNLEIMYQKARTHNVKMAFCSFIAPDPTSLKARERDFFEHNIRNLWKSKFITFDDYCNYTKIYNQYLKKMCEENNILFIPLAENFNPIMNDFWDICHLTDEGREKKADIISEFLIPFLTTEINSRHPTSISPVSSSKEAQLPR
jgi:lysophospholipase L1-like esterase